MSLDHLRQQLSDLDRRLIDLVAERQRIVAEIGRDKLSTGRATRDFAREKVVLESVRERAASLDLDPDVAEDLLRTLIRSSLTTQEHDRVAAEGHGDGRRALVIGGGGKMGGWFVDFFAQQGFATTIADPAAPAGARCVAQWQDAGLDFDVIVVATPLAISDHILAALAAEKPTGLIFDIGSLKTPLKAGIKALADAGWRVASLHPMFGPGTELLSGRHLVFVDTGCPDATADAKELFSATMVEKLDMGLDEHDRMIAYVLGLSHALNIAFFTALADSGEAAPQLAGLSSTTFDAQMLVSTAVASDNPHLYFEIQHLNEYGLEPLDALRESIDSIRSLVADGDEDSFVKLMRRGQEYLRQRR
ncbi:MAG: prephenate dehydrogenase/arogenate dehydrogenase family protein [Acidobacteria bacterium]|nr:prephenate dehydrogenase/arogenate dehydrogenase family protein [Acidobacteriota bacterium]